MEEELDRPQLAVWSRLPRLGERELSTRSRHWAEPEAAIKIEGS